MMAAFLIAFCVLCWKTMKFVFRWFFAAIYYVLAFVFGFVILLLSLTMNVFTVPLLIVVYAMQKHRKKQLPYVGSCLLIFYPTFTDPKITEERRKARREARRPQKVQIVHNDWLSDPLYWAY